MLTVINFIQRAVLQGTPLLYGATGEILTEKSGNLNLGIPGIMYIGAISGVVGGFMYQTSTDEVVPIIAVLIPFLCCLLGSLLVSLLYCFLTVTTPEQIKMLRVLQLPPSAWAAVTSSAARLLRSLKAMFRILLWSISRGRLKPPCRLRKAWGYRQALLLLRLYGVPCNYHCDYFRGIP